MRECSFSRAGFRDDATLAQSVKCVDQHVLLLRADRPHEWPKKPDDGAPIRAAFDALESARTLKLSVAHEFEPAEADALDGDEAQRVLVLPQGVQLRVPASDAAHRELAEYLAGTRAAADLAHATLERSLAGERLLAVCAHNAKDRRCGACGAALLTALRNAAPAAANGGRRVRVFGVSHVGGHAYAGNCLVFADSAGNGSFQSRWYHSPAAARACASLR